VRVHPDLLKDECIPDDLMGKNIWQERFEDISNAERYLTRNGVVIRKFFLNLSKGEQKRRFLQRLENPEKNWKFSASDIRERKYWDDYMKAYEEMIAATSKKHAPWYVVPADNKWYTRLVVAAAIVDALEELKLSYPKVSAEERKELLAARKELEGKK
jgi:polyphosphate kinase 2 (PPK2 family)